MSTLPKYNQMSERHHRSETNNAGHVVQGAQRMIVAIKWMANWFKDIFDQDKY